MEERWEFSPANTGVYSDPQLSNECIVGLVREGECQQWPIAHVDNFTGLALRSFSHPLLPCSHVAVAACPACCTSSSRQLSPDPIC
jgi:hypothetical protein